MAPPGEEATPAKPGAAGWPPPPAPWAPTDWHGGPTVPWPAGSAEWTPTGTVAPAPTYFWPSVICLLLFLPTAVVALLYSVQVRRCAHSGDGEGATRASRMARNWCLMSVLGAAVVFLLAAAGVLPMSAHTGGL